MSRSAPNNILSHHALRGIAAFLVLLFHFRDVTAEIGTAIDAHTSFLSTGFLWVDFFFVLSGFILSHVYGISMLDAHGRNAHATRRFYVARFARIYPLHLAMLVAMICVELSAYVLRPNIADAFVSERKALSSVVQHLTLTHSWITMHWLEWNVPSWSISTEAFAYLVFPLLLPVVHHRSLLVRAAAPAFAIAVYVHSVVGFADIQDQQPLMRCLAGFITGMCLFRLWHKSGELPSALTGALQLAAAAIAIAAMHYRWNQALVVAAFAALILTTASDRGALARILSARPLLLLGTLSYSMYMTHWVAYRLYWMYGNELFSSLASAYSPIKVYALKVAVLLTLTMGLSALAYFRIELPARGYLARLFARE